MKQFAIALSVCVLTGASTAWAAKVGQPAPDFSAADLQGKAVRLSDYRGKYVVLEWTNPECPYVRRHYSSGNMPSLHREFAAKDVVWLAVNSTRASHSEFKTPQEMAKWMTEQGGAPRATLMDKDSKVARLYDARTTPHMYIVDPHGRLIYAGAIDDKRWASTEETKRAKNHVRAALGEAMAGKPVSQAATSPYGCTVKY